MGIYVTVIMALTGGFLAYVGGVIGFRYPQPVANDPLEEPVRVTEVGEKHLVVEDGRRFAVDYPLESLRDVVRESDYRIDIEYSDDGHPRIFFDRERFFCGNRIGSPIHIPLVAVPYDARHRTESQFLFDEVKTNVPRY